MGFSRNRLTVRSWPDSSDRCRTQGRHCAGTPRGREATLAEGPQSLLCDRSTYSWGLRIATDTGADRLLTHAA